VISAYRERVKANIYLVSRALYSLLSTLERDRDLESERVS
jgi:hypothetical protein